MCSIEHSSHLDVMSTCVGCLLWWKSSPLVIRSFITNRLGVVMCACNPVSWKPNLWKTITNCGRYHLSICCGCFDNDSLVTQWGFTLWLISYVTMAFFGSSNIDDIPIVLLSRDLTSFWKMGQSGEVVVWPTALDLCMGDVLQLWHLWVSLFFLVGQSRERWFCAQ